jgi:hypothetical protein
VLQHIGWAGGVLYYRDTSHYHHAIVASWRWWLCLVLFHSAAVGTVAAVIYRMTLITEIRRRKWQTAVLEPDQQGAGDELLADDSDAAGRETSLIGCDVW